MAQRLSLTPRILVPQLVSATLLISSCHDSDPDGPAAGVGGMAGNLGGSDSTETGGSNSQTGSGGSSSGGTGVSGGADGSGADGSGAMGGAGAGSGAMGGADDGSGGVAGSGGASTDPSGYDWAFRYGDAALQNILGFEADSQGQFVAMGRFAGDLAFGDDVLTPKTSGGAQEVYLARFASDGTPVKAFTLGATYAHDLAIDNQDNVLVAGQATGPLDFGGSPIEAYSGSYLLKFDSDGNHVFSQGWSGVIPLGTTYKNHITADPFGNAWLAGPISAARDFGLGELAPSGFDIYLLKFSSAGVLFGSRLYGGAGDQHVSDIESDGIGNIYMVGYYSSDFTLGADALVAGSGQSLFVAKFDASGLPKWAKGFPAGVVDDQTAFQTLDASIAVSDSGDVVVSTEFSISTNFGGELLTVGGASDSLILGLNTEGEHVFSRNIGARVREVEFDSTGNVIVVGGINGEFDFDGQQVKSSGADELVLKLSPSGVALWAKVYGDDSTQEGWAVAVDPSDAIAAAVSGLGNIDFGGGLLEGQGNLDIFFHKLQ